MENTPTMSRSTHLTRAEIQRALRESSDRAKRETGAPVRGGRKTRLLLEWLLVALVLVGAFFVFRPQVLGGPVAYEVMRGNSMVPTLRNDDLVVARRHAQYHRGDVIIYRVPAGHPGAGKIVIDRIVGGTAATGFVTQGDNTLGPDPVTPKTADVLGSVWFYVGTVAGIIVLGAIVVLVLLIIVLFGVRRRRRRRRKVATSPGAAPESDPTGMSRRGPEPTAVPAAAAGPLAPTPTTGHESGASPSEPATATSAKPEALFTAASAIDTKDEPTALSRPVDPTPEMGGSAEVDAPEAVPEPMIWVEVARSPQTPMTSASSPEPTSLPAAGEALASSQRVEPVSWAVAEPEAEAATEDQVTTATGSSSEASPEGDPRSADLPGQPEDPTGAEQNDGGK